MDGNYTPSCPDVVLNKFSKRVQRQMWQVNGLMLFNTIVMGVVVFIGVFAPRYRHHSIIGIIFQGANTLFLPIASIVASTAMIDPESSLSYSIMDEWVTAHREAAAHNILVSVWTGLVIYVGIGTCVVVAGDSREGRNIGPSKELWFKAIWVAYLMGQTLLLPGEFVVIKQGDSYWLLVTEVLRAIFERLVLSIIFKIFQKCQVFYIARGSFMFGRNPRLIVSYMAQPDGSQDTEELEGHVVPPPSLVVMEGVPMTLQQQPHGYSYKSEMPPEAEHQQWCIIRRFLKKTGDIRRIQKKEGSKLVTLDKVWGLNDIYFLSSTPQAKDLCSSFALFKMLRCRFAKYTVYEAGFMKSRNFFLHTYLHGADYSRVFRVIADELSFFYDYFYSSMSIPFFHRQFILTRVTNLFLSILMCYYIFKVVSRTDLFRNYEQIRYSVKCEGREGHSEEIYSGYMYFDLVPVYFVIAAILISEIRETVSFICSNFNKVVLVCNYVINTRWPKFVAFVFKHLRCEWLLNNWDDKMSQCKLLVLHPWQTSILLRHLFRLPNLKKVKVPSEVKEAIFKALQGLASEEQGHALEHIRLPRSPISSSDSATDMDAQWACDGKAAADTILAWHIATSLFEVRHPEPRGHHLLDCKTAAVRQSQYCAYLVCYRPELLPDDAEWCETLYKTVSEDAARVLAGRAATSTPEAEFEQLAELLKAESNHEVLRHGASLAEQLVVGSETSSDEALTEELVDPGRSWEALARFWSEMILYVAPSENLDGHAEAISRGGELITLVWALLAHAGIVDRLDEATTTVAGHV